MDSELSPVRVCVPYLEKVEIVMGENSEVHIVPYDKEDLNNLLNNLDVDEKEELLEIFRCSGITLEL